MHATPPRHSPSSNGSNPGGCTMSESSWRLMPAIGMAIGILVSAASGVPAQSPTPKDPWPELASNLFNGRAIADGTGVLEIEMPGRAEDAAIVPLTLRNTLAPAEMRRLVSLTVVIDENPAPVAATFQIGPSAVVPVIATRVRVNSYTNVHAVAELSDGKLYGVKTYVKASGGCSAPAVKADKSGIGEMRLRQFGQTAEGAGDTRTAQIMIRHPNNSGLQMDQVTRLYIPPFFVQSLKVWQGDELLFALEGSISISEDPNIRFTYVPDNSRSLRAEAVDTAGHVFSGSWPSSGMDE
jgi:sulfur-oxidizing protein SoxY